MKEEYMGGRTDCPFGGISLRSMLGVLFLLLPSISFSSDFHPLLTSPPGLPGVKLIVHSSGLAYLNQISANILANNLPKLVIPDVRHRLNNDQGVININNIRVSRFRRAEQHLITTSPPNRLSWKMRNLDLGFIGELNGMVNIVIPFNLTGQAEILAEGLTFQLDSSIEKSWNGSGHVTSLYCVTTIRNVHVTNHNGGLFGLAVDVFKEGVSNNVRQLLQELICKKIRSYIDLELNAKLSEAQTKSPLAEAVETNALRSTKLPSGVSVLSLFSQELGEHFFIDFRLKEDPKCGINEVELASAGEISPQGTGKTPFGPSSMNWPPVLQREEPSMISLLVSDFLPNSLFYHAYKQGYTRLLLTAETPGVAPFLRTTCEGAFCIADLVPQLGDTYPNSSIELLLSATRAPAILFSEKNGGTISTALTGTAVVYAVTGNVNRKQVAVIDVEVVADAQLSLMEHTVNGNVQLTKFDLKNRLNSTTISDADLADISLLVSQLLENMINEMLSNGFPLPIPHVLKLHKTRISVQGRRMLIKTDVLVDERTVSRLAEKTIFRSPIFGQPKDPRRNITQIMPLNG